MTTTASVTVTMERPKYPIGVPSKFSPEGVVQRYPGNTTLCHLPADSPLIPGLWALYEALKSHPFISQRMSLLPPESWHMTVLDGVRELECEPGMWPQGKEKQPLAESTAEFAYSLRQLGLQLAEEGLAPPYRMKVRRIGEPLIGVGVLLEGATPEEEKRMRRLRDRLAEALGFKAPNHTTYEFHLSVAYLLRHFDGDDWEELKKLLDQHVGALQKEFELGPVEFCTFEDMCLFSPLLRLGDEKQP